MTFRRGLLQLLLAALLFAAQTAALTHGLRHWQPGQPAHPVQSQQHEGGKSKAASLLCDFHVAFAEVLGAVDGCASRLPVLVQTAERGVDLRTSLHSAAHVVPAARGPPALL